MKTARSAFLILALFASGASVVFLSSCITHEPAELTGESESKVNLAVSGLIQADDALEWVLAPRPRSLEASGDAVSLSAVGDAWTPPATDTSIARIAADVEHVAATLGVQWNLVEGSPLDKAGAAIFVIDPARVPEPQGYSLAIGPDGIEAIGADPEGLHYAVMTLIQLARQNAGAATLPVLEIYDWPDFPNRGIMLDIARDKVPTMETLFALVDKMAEWKLNQLQLYMEHTFAYPGHEVVWRNASPMTPEEFRALDAYCVEQFIELVPNQNSFGHMGRWLQHPEYAHLAETPGGGDLCPTDPGSIALLRDMYSSLLPNFSSSQFNVGCDETFSIGKGKSADAVKAKGEGRVYLDFLTQIHELLSGHGRTMQFWGDIIMAHPELIPELPDGVIAMEWGYEANHPFAEHGAKFAESGVPFYVVPGTSSWNSLVGRTDNAIANLRNAARNGLANGAIGFLITDWGDGGHWQFLPISYLGYLFGASVSWNVEQNEALNIGEALDVYVFEDASGAMGRVAYDLGNAYQVTGVEVGNNTAFNGLLNRLVDEPIRETWLKTTSIEKLTATIAYVDSVMAAVDTSQMSTPDADLVASEFRTGADLVRFACRLGIARLESTGVGPGAIPTASAQALAAELESILPEYRRLWLARNREGGLSDSMGRFETLVALLKR